MGLAAPAGRGRPGRQRLHAGCATSSRRVGWGVRGHVAQWRPQTRGLFGCGGLELRPFPTHTCFRRLAFPPGTSRHGPLTGSRQASSVQIPASLSRPSRAVSFVARTDLARSADPYERGNTNSTTRAVHVNDNVELTESRHLSNLHRIGLILQERERKRRLQEASSAESVGEFWFGQVAKCVIQSDFQCPGGAEPRRPFGDHSGLSVEAFDNATGELPPGSEPVQNQVAVRAQPCGQPPSSGRAASASSGCTSGRGTGRPSTATRSPTAIESPP